MRFQSTLPLRGATKHETGDSKTRYISIHAPLAGSDIGVCLVSGILMNFNPRSPCGERHYPDAYLSHCSDFNPRSPCGERPPEALAFWIALLFQSTLPLRGATSRLRAYAFTKDDFNPRSPCGERPVLRIPSQIGRIFQSTLPLRGATVVIYVFAQVILISIHAPLAGSDPTAR